MPNHRQIQTIVEAVLKAENEEVEFDPGAIAREAMKQNGGSRTER